MGSLPHEAPSSSPRGTEDARDSTASLPDSPAENHPAAGAGKLRNSDRRKRPSRTPRSTKGRLPLHRVISPSRLLRPEEGLRSSLLSCSIPPQNPKSSRQREDSPRRLVPQILPTGMILPVAPQRSHTLEGSRVSRDRGPSCFREMPPEKDKNEDQFLARVGRTIYRASPFPGRCDNAPHPHTRGPSPCRSRRNA